MISDGVTRYLGVIVFVAMAASKAVAQSEPPPDPNVVLHISIVGGERPFRIGETIPLQLEFSTQVGERYQINRATYDRSGRMEYERFDVAPSGGTVDPLAGRAGGVMGGLTSFQFLNAQPWSLRLNINEWIRFTRPGTYQLTVTSRRVDIKNSSSVRGSSTVLVSAAPITLTIIPATQAWENALHQGAVATLNRPAPARPPLDPYYRTRADALTSLRFLGSPAAIRELVNRLRGDPVGGEDSICIMGLLAAPYPDVARQALEDALEDPDRPVHSGLLNALARLNTTPGPLQWQEANQRALETLVKALPEKRGRAAAISAMTAVNEAWNFVPLPEGTTSELVRQLITHFDELPPQQQAFLLEDRWDKFGSAALLPVVRRHAVAFNDPIDQNSPDGYATRRLAATALRRWYELDPASARPAILAEITRPNPRYDARILGLLPDPVLPGIELRLAGNFAGTRSGRIASLIARYATGAVLASVLSSFDPLLGKLACEVQAPILAYALRVDPALARPRIEQALAAREVTGCYQYLLTEIADIYYDPVLEEIARRGLDDENVGVRRSSATLLGRFGSPGMEPVLLARYSRWVGNWAGRESELNPAFADSGAQLDAINDGASLLGALTTAKSWLTGEDKLRSLISITRALRLRQQLEANLKSWSELTITVSTVPGSTRIDGHVAQYTFDSMQALENKLEQFPMGTRFVLRSGADTPAARAATEAVGALLRDRGMTAVAPR